MSSQIDKIVDLYKALSKFPSPTSARILNKHKNASNIPVISTWSQRNLEIGKTGKFQQYHWVDVSNKKSKTSLPSDCSNVLLSTVSPDEEYNAIIREVPGDSSNGSKKVQYLEIWRACHLWKNFDLTSREVHGDVYSDGEFGVLEWSWSGNKLLYVAERKYPKSEPFYKTKPQSKPDEGSGDSSGDKKINKGEEHLFREDWGEQLLGKSESVFVEVNVETELFTVLEDVPINLCPGQGQWAPDDGVVGVAWDTSPRRLGLVFCSNRVGFIFHLSSQGQFTILSDEGKAVRSPRFSPDGRHLVWLEREVGGPHNGSHRLICLDWSSRQKTVVIDVIKDELQIEGKELFYGLYNLSLPKRCWIGKSQLVLSTPQKYTVNTYIVDVVTKQMTRLAAEEGSLQALDVCHEGVICSYSAFNKPSVLLLGKISCEKSVAWITLTETPDTSLLQNISYQYMDLVQGDEPEADVKSFSAMYIGPKEGKEGETPFVVFPHGGPHSGNVNMFTFSVALFNLLGWGVLLVNYRGSTGAGERSVLWLTGHAGISDVNDVRLATATALCRFPHLARRPLLFGGSHGGFLVAHLSGRFPEDYKAVASINPVIDVMSMFSVTDIPDWTCVEAGVPFNIAGQIPIESLAKMKNMSPLSHFSPASPPTLLLLGKKDARVPMSQGIAWYHSLKAHGVKTKVLMYDDNHSLSQVPVEIDSLVNSILWFYEHL